MWRELHLRALSFSGDGGGELAWLERFARRLTCDACRHHWRQLVADHPPDLRDRRRYFLWTVRAHNAVNQRLGRPAMLWRDACRVWGANFDSAANAS